MVAVGFKEETASERLTLLKGFVAEHLGRFGTVKVSNVEKGAYNERKLKPFSLLEFENSQVRDAAQKYISEHHLC